MGGAISSMSGSAISEDDFFVPNPSFRNVTRSRTGAVENSRTDRSAGDLNSGVPVLQVVHSPASSLDPIAELASNVSFVPVRRSVDPEMVAPLPASVDPSERSGGGDDFRLLELLVEQPPDLELLSSSPNSSYGNELPESPVWDFPAVAFETSTSTDESLENFDRSAAVEMFLESLAEVFEDDSPLPVTQALDEADFGYSTSTDPNCESLHEVPMETSVLEHTAARPQLSIATLPVDAIGHYSIAVSVTVGASTTPAVVRPTAEDSSLLPASPIDQSLAESSKSQAELCRDNYRHLPAKESVLEKDFENVEQAVFTLELDCNDEPTSRIESVRQRDPRPCDFSAPMTRDFALYAAQTLLDSDIMPAKDRNSLRRAIEAAVGPFKQREARRLAVVMLSDKTDSKRAEKVSRSYRRIDTLCLDGQYPPWLQYSIDILNEIARLNRGACYLLVYRNNTTGDYHLEIADHPPAQSHSGNSFVLAALQLSLNDGALTAGGRYRTFSDSFRKLKPWRP